MKATVEIDKSGRLVLPKKMRDDLHLVPGARLSIRQTQDSIILELEAKPRGLFLKEGVWVYDPGPIPAQEAVDSVHHAREARTEQLLSASDDR